jgi:hypothetical protein
MATIPSLALIPSGYKASKVYSVLPTDGTGDFDFTRSGDATRVNSEGLIELVSTNVPRLNYPLIDGVVSGCPSLLLEPSRTNLALRSEEFDNASWNKANASITSNVVISPDGSLSADKIIATATTGSHAVFLSISSATSGLPYCYSFFAKAEEYTKTAIRIGGGGYSSQPMAVINLLNGTVISQQGFTSVSVSNFNNGWYKINAVFTATASVALNIQPIADGFITTADNYTYTGEGTSGVYIWGAQLEQGSYATSYIPSLTGSQTTRSAETCNNAGDVNTFNDSEGVLFAEISALANDGTYRMISLSNGNIANSTNIQYSGVSNQIRARIENGGLPQADITSTVTSQTLFNKIAVLYKSNQFELWSNGFKVGEDTNGTPPSGLSELAFDNGAGSTPFYGNTKQIQYYDSALNDSDLETLTSWVSFTDMATSQLYTIE